MATDIINSQNLTPVPTTQVPTYQPTPVDPSIAQGAIASVAGQYDSVNKQLAQAQADQKAQADSQLSMQTALLGKTADTQAYQDQTGVNTETANLNKYAQQLADLNAQASSLNRDSQAIPIANRMNQQRLGTVGTESQVQNANYDQLQQNALKALSIAQQSDIASAALTGSQIKLQAAKDKAQQMVDLKYKPLEDQLAIKKQQYELNKDVLTQLDKKRTEALNASIKQEEAQIAEKKANEKGIQDIAVTLRKYGISDSVVKDVLSSNSINDALLKAGTNLQDPKAKLELQSIKADIILKEAQARKVDREAILTKEPTVAEKKASALAVTQAKSSAQAAQDKIDAIDSILTFDSGIASRVGPNVLARGIIGPAIGGAATGAATASIVPGVGTAIGGVVGGILGASKGIGAAVSGQGQQLSGAVHQLTAGLTLKELQDAKANGATFGSLTDGERNMLAAAATKLNDWEVKDDKGNPTGYWNINETSFKQELKTIQDLNRKALLKSQGTLIAPDESSQLDSMFPQEQPSANQYYQ